MVKSEIISKPNSIQQRPGFFNASLYFVRLVLKRYKIPSFKIIRFYRLFVFGRLIESKYTERDKSLTLILTEGNCMEMFIIGRYELNDMNINTYRYEFFQLIYSFNLRCDMDFIQ